MNSISVLILGVHDPYLPPGGLQDPGDGETLLQRHEAALRGPALQTPPHVLGLDTWHVARHTRDISYLVCEVCAVDAVEGMFGASWEGKLLHLAVTVHQLHRRPELGQLQCSLRSDNHSLNGPVIAKLFPTLIPTSLGRLTLLLVARVAVLPLL